MNTDTLEASRELDALVAQHIFGWRWLAWSLGTRERRRAIMPPDVASEWETETPGVDVTETQGEFKLFSDWDRAGALPAYSTDPAAMLQVVERMESRFQIIRLTRACKLWHCDVHVFAADDILGETYSTHADSAPLAVSRAALLAVAQEVK